MCERLTEVNLELEQKLSSLGRTLKILKEEKILDQEMIDTLNENEKEYLKIFN